MVEETTEKPRRGRPPKPRTYSAAPMQYGVQVGLNRLWHEILTHCNAKRGQEAHEAWTEFQKITNQYIKAE